MKVRASRAQGKHQQGQLSEKTNAFPEGRGCVNTNSPAEAENRDWGQAARATRATRALNTTLRDRKFLLPTDRSLNIKKDCVSGDYSSKEPPESRRGEGPPKSLSIRQQQQVRVASRMKVSWQ